MGITIELIFFTAQPESFNSIVLRLITDIIQFYALGLQLKLQ